MTESEKKREEQQELFANLVEAFPALVSGNRREIDSNVQKLSSIATIAVGLVCIAGSILSIGSFINEAQTQEILKPTQDQVLKNTHELKSSSDQRAMIREQYKSLDEKIDRLLERK